MGSRRLALSASLICLGMSSAAFADVLLTDQQLLRQRVQAFQSGAGQQVRSSALVVPADLDEPQTRIGDPLIGTLLIDSLGFNWLFDTNVTYTTSSSASGAAAEGAFLAAVQSTTINGAVQPAILDDGFDGYNSIYVTVGVTRASYNLNGALGASQCAGRQLVFNEQNIGGLLVSRRVYVPTNDSFARWLNVLRNPGASPLTVVLETANNLGSDGLTQVVDSSTSDALATTSDDWVTTFRNYEGTVSSGPRIGHIFQGPGAPVRLAGITFANGNDHPNWRYNLIVPPNSTAILANFATGQGTKPAARAKSIEIANGSATSLECLTDAEKAQIANFRIPGFTGGVFDLSSATYAIDEAAGAAVVTINRTTGAKGPATVNFTTTNGTATAGSDYTTATGEVTFLDGETSKTLPIPITNDLIDEPDETINITITGVTGDGLNNPSLGTLAAAVVTVTDDDGPAGNFVFAASAYAVAEGGGIVTLTVARTGGSTGDATVSYATIPGTATAGSDYTAATGSVVFANGELSKTFNVSITNDTTAESTEAFTASLTGVTSASGTSPTIGSPGVSQVNIIDDDTTTATSSVAFSAGTFLVGEEGATATIGITRTGSTADTVTVSYATSNGTATAGLDYTTTIGSVTFAPGDVTKSLVVPIIEDALAESAETVNLALTGVTGGTAVLGAPTTAVLTINDNDSAGSARLAFSSDAFVAAEGGGVATISITRTGPTTETVTVSYTTSDGTATAGLDYTAATGTVTFAPGDVTKTFIVPILDDDIAETAETVQLALTGITGGTAVLTAPVAAILTINDHSVVEYYLPEGATGPFFDLDILIANPNPTPVPVRLTFLKPDGTVVTKEITLAGQSRTTVRVDPRPALPGGVPEPGIEGLESTPVSTIVASLNGLPLAVEASMFWDSNYYGSHTASAVDGARNAWYFAEGSQGFFDTFLLLANPNLASGTAVVTFLPESGAPIVRTVPLGPTSRFTLATAGIPELAGRSFSMVVDSSVPVLAARAMYFGTPLFNGGHASTGVGAPANSWFLAEGATGSFFQTYILMANPNAAAATVILRYLKTTGEVITTTKTIPGNSRMTVDISSEDASLATAEVSTQITASLPIVVERSMFWAGAFAGWRESHNSFGVTATGTRWTLAEGRVGQAQGYETYILLANPNAAAAQVRVQFLRRDGTTVSKIYVVAANSRLNVYANSLPELSNEDFGALIEVINGVPIVVERSLYNSAGGVPMAAGTNAVGIRIP